MRRGLTLIEVSIALVIMGVVMAGAYSFFSFGTRAAGRTNARSGAVDTVASAFVQITRRARYAETISSPTPGRPEAVLEYSSRSTGAWTISVVEGQGLVLQEKFGGGHEVLAPGVAAVEFRKDTLLEDDMLEVTLTHGTGEGARTFRTVLYTRGTRRASGG